MQTENKFKYPSWAKMPENYDFSTTGMDWSKFYKEFILRTDAVWEKSKLKDVFRLYHQLFYFDQDDEKYYKIELLFPHAHKYFSYNEDSSKIAHDGFSKSGRTSSFEFGRKTFDPVSVSSQTNYLKQDLYELCAYRFNRWFECDFTYNQKAAEFAKNKQEYPCQKLYWETEYSCSDHMIDFLFELAHVRHAKGIMPKMRSNQDLLEKPQLFDSPNADSRHRFTY